MKANNEEAARLYDKLIELGWSGYGACDISKYAEKDTGFGSYIKRRFLGKKSKRKIGTKKATIPRKLRKAVYERDAYRCQICNGWTDLSVDHIIPESLGGETTLNNLQTLCMPCNMKKGNRGTEGGY